MSGSNQVLHATIRFGLRTITMYLEYSKPSPQNCSMHTFCVIVWYKPFSTGDLVRLSFVVLPVITVRYHVSLVIRVLKYKHTYMTIQIYKLHVYYGYAYAFTLIQVYGYANTHSHIHVPCKIHTADHYNHSNIEWRDKLCFCGKALREGKTTSVMQSHQPSLFN